MLPLLEWARKGEEEYGGGKECPFEGSGQFHILMEEPCRL